MAASFSVDLAGAARIGTGHLTGALNYRRLDRGNQLHYLRRLPEELHQFCA